MRFRTNKIIVSGSIAEDSSSSETTKGFIKPRLRNEYLPRRTTLGLVNFYDFGRIKNLDTQEFEDLDFSYLIPIIPEAIASISFFTIEICNLLKDKIFEIPINQWKSRYYKLDYEDAEKMYLDVYLGDSALEIDQEQYFPIARVGSRNKIIDDTPITETKWTDKGLDATGDFLSVYTGGLFSSFTNQDIKITSEPSPTAEAVPFSVTSTTDVFLVPALILENMIAINNIDSSTHLLNHFWVALSRELFFDTDIVTEIDALGTPLLLRKFIDGAIETLSYEHPIVNLIKNKLNLRDSTRYLYETPPTITSDDPENFPNFNEINSVLGANFSNVTNIPNDSVNVYHLVNSLACVVSQGSNIFYFWYQELVTQDFYLGFTFDTTP
ncbi:MAG: hypothetical protein WBP82_00320 [Leuconostoc mesenteroides]